MKKHIKGFSLSRHDSRHVAQLTLRFPKRQHNVEILNYLSSFPGVQLDNLE